MNINKVKAYIICLIFASLPIVNVGGAVHNSGVMYNIEKVDESQILIEISKRDENTSEGIKIIYYYLVNGKPYT